MGYTSDYELKMYILAVEFPVLRRKLIQHAQHFINDKVHIRQNSSKVLKGLCDSIHGSIVWRQSFIILLAGEEK